MHLEGGARVEARPAAGEAPAGEAAGARGGRGRGSGCGRPSRACPGAPPRGKLTGPARSSRVDVRARDAPWLVISGDDVGARSRRGAPSRSRRRDQGQRRRARRSPGGPAAGPRTRGLRGKRPGSPPGRRSWRRVAKTVVAEAMPHVVRRRGAGRPRPGVVQAPVSRSLM